MKYLIKTAFMGTGYAGYQIQKNALTVQQVLCESAKLCFGCECNVTGCSRTDSGVHARAFFCTLEPKEECANIPPEGLPFAMNHILPNDISVLWCKEVPEDFHPRYDVKYKEYEYVIYNGGQRDPFYYNRAYHCSKKLDEELMDLAAEKLCGKHDFRAFMAKGSDTEDTVRDVKYCRVSRDGDIVRINIAADGFLYNMVRIIVGTLINVSYGKTDIREIEKIIESKDRSRAGFTAPPEGLYLNDVIY